MTARIQIRMPSEIVLSGPYIATPLGRLDQQLAYLTTELEPCEWCGEDGHWVTCRAAPHPGDCPPPGAIVDLAESCSCCMFGGVGHPERGLLVRLQRESADDRDIDVEVLSPEGRWL